MPAGMLHEGTRPTETIQLADSSVKISTKKQATRVFVTGVSFFY